MKKIVAKNNKFVAIFNNCMTEESHRYLSAFAYFAFRSYLEMEQTRGGVKLEFVRTLFDSIRKFDFDRAKNIRKIL